MPTDKKELIQQRIEESEACFKAAKEAVEVHLQSLEVRAKAAMEEAKQRILSCTVSLASSSAVEEDSALVVAVETAHRKQAILDNLEEAEKILRERMEQARAQIARFRKLLNRLEYVERCKELIVDCIPVSDQQRQALASMAIDSVSAAEAHRLCEALNEHCARNQRLKINGPFEFSVKHHGADDQISAFC